MATILLQAAGAFLGGVLGPVGSAIGSAAGALAGYAIDRALIDSTRHVEGPRLTGARAFTAEEGASIPRVYGAARLGGTLIWATHFEAVRRSAKAPRGARASRSIPMSPMSPLRCAKVKSLVFAVSGRMAAK